MRTLWTIPLMMMTVACGANREAPASPPADDNSARTDIAEEPVAEPVAAPTAACPEGDVVILKQTRAPLRGEGAPVQTLTVYDNGHWALAGAPAAEVGCLSAEQVSTLQASIASADITAPPLAPGMARCMAMPLASVTVEASGKSATWDSPCGAANPSPSLSELLGQLAALTSGQ